MNLKTETLEVLKLNKKTVDDIRWIGTKYETINAEKFWQLADTEYDNGYGAQKVATDLLIVGDDWWLERESYDGAEHWEYKSIPALPKRKMINIDCLTVEQYNKLHGIRKVGWCILAELNEDRRYELNE